jgi:hypothetical protein
LEDTALLELEGRENEESIRVIEGEGEDNQGGNKGELVGGFQKNKNKRGVGGALNRKGDVVNDRIPKESKLAKRGGSFKGKSGLNVKKGVDSIVDRGGVELLEKVLGQKQQSKVTNNSNVGEKTLAGQHDFGSGVDGRFRPISVNNPNVPRPPNWPLATPILMSNTTNIVEMDQVGDGEKFEDANDQASLGSQDSDMDVVVETISLS